jgi:hypothetical protein
MMPMTIPFQVINGQLRSDANLAALEGQHGIATLTVVPKDADNGNGQTAPAMPSPDESTEFDPEPPPWLQVEQDLYFPIKCPAKSLGKVKVRRRRGKPCIILPEELPDE